MEYLVRVSERALRDLERIYEYIEGDSSDAAFAWFNDLTETIYSLERFPERGQVTPEDRKLRHLLFGRAPGVYRIIYGVDKRRGAVEILHVRHSARGSFPTEREGA